MDYRLLDDKAIIADLAEKVDRLRLEKRLKDEDLERAAGVSRQLISSFRNGKRNISLKSFIRLLRGIDELDRLQGLFPAEEPYSPRQGSSEDLPKRVRDRQTPSGDRFKWGDEE